MGGTYLSYHISTHLGLGTMACMGVANREGGRGDDSEPTGYMFIKDEAHDKGRAGNRRQGRLPTLQTRRCVVEASLVCGRRYSFVLGDVLAGREKTWQVTARQVAMIHTLVLDRDGS